MKLSCGCLNIQIHTEGNPTSKNADPIPDFIGSTFNSIVDLHKAIPSLVLTKTVNQFKVVACLVCFLNVYCYTAENTNTLIVNNLALRDKAIDQLKLHADYSSIFQIKIPYNEFNSETGTDKHFNQYLNVEQSLKAKVRNFLISKQNSHDAQIKALKMKLQSEMDFLELEGNAACNSILNNLNHHMGNQNTTHQNEIVNETRPDVIVDNLNSGLTFSADDDAMFSFDERPRIVSKYTTDEIEFDKIDVKAEKEETVKFKFLSSSLPIKVPTFDHNTGQKIKSIEDIEEESGFEPPHVFAARTYAAESVLGTKPSNIQ